MCNFRLSKNYICYAFVCLFVLQVWFVQAQITHVISSDSASVSVCPQQDCQIIQKLVQGDSLVVNKMLDQDWAEVVINGQQVFIPRANIQAIVYIVAEDVILRSCAQNSADCPPLDTLYQNTLVLPLVWEKDWVQVKNSQGVVGFVS